MKSVLDNQRIGSGTSSDPWRPASWHQSMIGFSMRANASGVMVYEVEDQKQADLSAAVELYDEANAEDRPTNAEAATLRAELQARGFKPAQLDVIDAKEEVVTRQRVPEVRDPETGEVITPEVPEVRQMLHATRRERAERIIDQLTNRIR